MLIPADEVAQCEIGQPVRVWIDGLESKPVEGRIATVRPRSEIREAKNVFVAEVVIENTSRRLRPGMHGHARIRGKSHPLAWNLFHKPWNFLASRLTWW